MNTEREIIAPEPGRCIHVDMENERYHGLGNWSSTQLKYLPADPESFHWKYILRRDAFKAPTRQMVMGTALHAWLLEGVRPTRVPDSYLTKAGSMKPGGWDLVAQEFPGVPVLKQDEIDDLTYARDNCFADPEIRAYLETAGAVEHSLFMVDPDTRLPTRVRLDKLCLFQTGHDVLDLKFSGGIIDRWIEKQITEMQYYRQAGMYWEHVCAAYDMPQRFVFLFVLNVPPYTARLKQLMPCDLELGMRHTHAALRNLLYRLTSNDWNGDGFGHVGITQVSRWLWERKDSGDPPAQPFEEFEQFTVSRE